MNEARYILKAFPDNFTGNFLCLGEFEAVTDDLIAKGWSGVIVDHKAAEYPGHLASDKIRYVHGVIQTDAHFIPVGPNIWMKAITLRCILDSFSGSYNALIVNLPSVSKDVVCSDTVWSFWPKIICVNAEGREQEIANLTAAHSYTVTRIERDAMILVRPDAE